VHAAWIDTDQKLMFEQKRFCGDGTYATWAEQPRERDQQVDGEDKEFAHGANRNHEHQGAQSCMAHASSLILRIRYPQVVGDEGMHRYLIHDRDRISAKHLDDSIRALGIKVLRSPVASPKANSVCERVIGTIRRECLDWMIPMSEAHLRAILKSWVEHYNRGRPHSSLGPGVPDPPAGLAILPKSQSRHRLAVGAFVLAKSVLDGLHHEYSLVTAPALA